MLNGSETSHHGIRHHRVALPQRNLIDTAAVHALKPTAPPLERHEWPSRHQPFGRRQPQGKRRNNLLPIAGALPAQHIFPKRTPDLPIEQRQCGIDGARRAGPRGIDHAADVSQQGDRGQLSHLVGIEEIGADAQRPAMATLPESRQRRNPDERAPPEFPPRRGENSPIAIFRLPSASSVETTGGEGAAPPVVPQGPTRCCADGETGHRKRTCRVRPRRGSYTLVETSHESLTQLKL